MKKQKLYLGGLKNVRGEKQQEMLTGRPENLADKKQFKTSVISGGQRTDPGHRARVVRGKKGGSE